MRVFQNCFGIFVAELERRLAGRQELLDNFCVKNRVYFTSHSRIDSQMHPTHKQIKKLDHATSKVIILKYINIHHFFPDSVIITFGILSFCVHSRLGQTIDNQIMLDTKKGTVTDKHKTRHTLEIA